jgi:NADH dehydrogenase FAD-containing subunit
MSQPASAVRPGCDGTTHRKADHHDAPGRRFAVVGAGLTGIEAAAELAEAYPDLR